MSDITKADLRKTNHPHGHTVIERDGCKLEAVREVTDEEFDRLAREAGYFKHDDGSRAIALHWGRFHHGRMLRALLTDPCNMCGGLGYGDVYQPVTDPVPRRMDCGVCDGRGWLPNKMMDLLIDTLNDDLMLFDRGRIRDLLSDWLEADDEQ